MKPFLTLLCATTLPLSAFAALAPVHQNPRDLAVLVEFAQQHRTVMESLRSIDLQHKAVHFGQDCVARFGRVAGPPIPGATPALQFMSATCPVGPREDGQTR